MASMSSDDPNALGSDGLPQFAHTTTQTFGGKESTRSGVEPGQRLHYARQLSPVIASYLNQLNKEAGRHRMSSSQEQQVGGAWSVSLDFRPAWLQPWPPLPSPLP
ncbi:hypothetical protein V8C86DRAFT_2446202 [Haematococcus lacustris]